MPPDGVRELLERARLPLGRPAAELGLGAQDRLGVEQVGELGLAALAEQLGQQRRVEGQRGRAALGERGVAVVEELRGVAEQQRLREGRRLRGGHLDDADPPRRDVAHQGGERVGVEVVLQALADGLEQDREVGVLRPRPTAAARTAAAAATAAGGGPGRRRGSSSARLAASRNRAPNIADEPSSARTASSTSSGSMQQVRQVDRRARRLRPRVVDPEPALEARVEHVRQPQHDPVVRVHRRRVDAVPLAQPGADDDRPRGVHAGAVRGVQHDPPVAQLVAEPLDHQRPCPTGPRRSPRAARAGRSAGCRRPTGRGPRPRRAARASSRRSAPSSRTQRAHRLARARRGGRVRRPSRTAAARAPRARA